MASQKPLIFLFAFFVTLLITAWRLDRSRRLVTILILAGIGQVLVSWGLYLLTIFPWPEIKRFVLGKGFWLTFGDAFVYFNKGISLSKTGFSAAAEHPSSALFVILINLATNGIKQPEIGGIILNGLLHLTLIPCAYYFLMQRKNEKIGILGALGIGVMSSGYLYSSQILRDPLIWVMFIILLGFVINVAPKMRPESSSTKNTNLVLFLGIICTTAFLTEMRVWLPICVIISLSIAVIANYCGTRKTFYPLLGVIACLLSGFFIGLQKPASSFSIFLDKEKRAQTKMEKLYTSSEILEKDKSKTHDFWSSSSIRQNCKDIIHTSSLALERIKEKIMRLKYDWKSLGMAFLLFDAIGLAFWKNFLERNRKNVLIKNSPNPFFENPRNIILITLMVEIIFVSVIYSDSVGNLPRYMWLATIPFVFYIVSNLPRSFFGKRKNSN